MIASWVGTSLLAAMSEEGEAYSRELAARLEGFRFSTIVVTAAYEIVGAGSGALVAMDCDHEDEQFLVHPGASEISSVVSRRVYPSLAHLLIEATLTRAELAELAASPATWRPSRAVDVAAPVAPLALDRRSRAWAIVGSTLMVLLMPLFMVLVGSTVAPTLAWAAFALLGLVAAAVFVASIRRLYEVFVLEPRARDLVVDDEGFTAHGERIRWKDVRLTRGTLVFALAHTDGRRFEIPRSLFRDPARAESVLRARTGP